MYMDQLIKRRKRILICTPGGGGGVRGDEKEMQK
jgi:hypothetical protein